MLLECIHLNVTASDSEKIQLCVTRSTLIPNDPSRLLIATEYGVIINQSRYNSSIFPRYFYPTNYYSGQDGRVSSIDVNPFQPTLFLASYDSGKFSMFRAGDSAPVCTWDMPTEAVSSICWSTQRPSVFYVLGDAGTLSIYDLSESNRGPVYSGGLGAGAIHDMALSTRMDGEGKRHASIGFARSEGVVEVFLLGEEYCESMVDEEESLAPYLRV
jgi:WD40 repeat protein